MWYRVVIAALGSYLLGNLNGAVIVSRVMAHEDVRSHGSGNAGLTNFIRNYGVRTAALVILIDVGKAVAACLLGQALLSPLGCAKEGQMLGAACVLLGHIFPALLGFRGGKGIAVSFGCLLGLAPELKPLLVLAAVFILFSTVIEVSPHYYRTLATYIAAIPVMFLAVRSWAVRGGFLLIAQTIISKLLGSKEEKDKLEVKVGWKY